MTQSIPTGVLALVLLALALSAAITWARRGRYANTRLSRLTMLADFTLISLMIVMIAAAIIQVGVRFFFSRHIIIGWTEELAILALIWLSFLAGAMLVAEGGHIAFEAICHALPARLQRANLVLVEILTIVILLPIMWYGYESALSLDIIMTVSLGLPLVVFGAVVPLAALLMILLTLFQLFRLVRTPLSSSVDQEGDR